MSTPSSPTPSRLSPRAFPTLVVTPTPDGFTIAPRGRPADLWIEAIVWVAGAFGLGLCLLLGGSVLRVIGAIGLVSIGIRALVRLVRALMGPTMRTMRVALWVPRPYLAGPLVSVALDEVAGLGVAERQSLVGLVATTYAGKESFLPAIDPPHTADYQQLAAWLSTFTVRR